MPLPLARVLMICSFVGGCGQGTIETSRGSDASGPGNAADAAPTTDSASGSAAGDDAASGEGATLCDFAAPLPPPAGVLWPAAMSADGAQTLGGHGHDDGNGPVGHCADERVDGEPYFELIAAGLEIDADVNSDGDQGDSLAVDFWRDPDSYQGFAESGGRVNIYVEVVDEDGAVLSVASAPQLRVERWRADGTAELFPLTSKPASEFQTNFPMTGGGARFGIGIEGQSDRVINLRLPVNHHVSYALVFQRQ